MNEFELLHTVIEESPIAMALCTGRDMTISLVNKCMLNIWQKDRSIIDKPFRTAIPESYTPTLDQHLKKVYNSGKSFEIPERRWDQILNNKLRVFYYHVILKPIKEADGSTLGILITAIDVTAQVQAQQEVEVKEDVYQNDLRFRNLIAQAPVAIGLLHGWDMLVETANTSLLELWGKDESIIGLNLLDALPEIKEQPFIMDLLHNVYATNKPHYGYETLARMHRNDVLEDAYFNFVYWPVTEADGKVSGVMIVASEVTVQIKAKLSLEESEQRFKSLILEAPMATALFTGRELLIEVANEAMLKVWGKDASVIGRPLASALPELQGQPFLQLLDEVYTSGLAYQNNASKADLVVDGKLQPFYLNFTYKPLLDANGLVYGIINTAIDVSRQVKARLELEELSRKKDEFLSVASHELKTPLTSLKASMQLLGRLFNTDPTSSVIPVFIKKSNISLIKILTLIDDLMHLSKMQQGQISLNKRWFKLSDLINDCCDHIRAQNMHELVLKGDTELKVYADFSRIDQVVVNFVNNAVKYAPGSKKIILRIEKKRDNARMSVQDFGIGIPSDKQEHLFDRYYRVDSSGIQFSGLGLGLYISAEIIARHGGKIGVDSTPGKGSTFWFTLPL